MKLKGEAKGHKLTFTKIYVQRALSWYADFYIDGQFLGSMIRDNSNDFWMAHWYFQELLDYKNIDAYRIKGSNGVQERLSKLLETDRIFYLKCMVRIEENKEEKEKKQKEKA